MKKLILFLIFMIFGVSVYAESSAISEGIKIINDSTIIYYDTSQILVNQPESVYTAIFRLPTYAEMQKGEIPILMMASSGSYYFVTSEDHGNYILYTFKSFDEIFYRISEYKSYY